MIFIKKKTRGSEAGWAPLPPPTKTKTKTKTKTG
jgi:hypothetical protein